MNDTPGFQPINRQLPAPGADESPSPTPSPAASEDFSSSDAEPAPHVLDAPFPGADDAESDTGAGDGAAGQVLSARVLSREEFYQAFKAILAAPGMIAPHLGGPPFASLAVQPAEEAAARACADAIYDTACEVRLLRWLIEPGNKWVQRSLAIGMFTVPKALAVRAELGAHRASSTERQPASGGAAGARPDAPAAPPASARPAHQDGASLNVVAAA